MRPLRCSIRPGFQGRSKWNRSVQCAWKFRPSRAASVAIRMRSGSSAGIRVEAALDLLAVGARGLAVDGLDPLVGEVGAGDGLLQHLAQVALRADHVLGEDQHPPVSPVRAVGTEVVVDPADQTCGSWRPAGRGRRRPRPPSGRADPARRATAPRHPAVLSDALSTEALMAAIWAASSDAFSSSVCSARSSSASGGLANRDAALDATASLPASAAWPPSPEAKRSHCSRAVLRCRDEGDGERLDR